jgi:perosamine synthetase
MDWNIPLFKTYSDEADVEAVARVIRRGTFWACGPEIVDLEKQLADYIGAKHALLCNSGTSALHMLLSANDVSGGEVIVPSFSFIATANAVLLAGATPVFAEIEDETFGLTARSVEQKMTNKTKAVIIMHCGGCPAKESFAIRELCKDRGILFLEDAAQSFGATIESEKVGNLGDGAIFSFCQNKLITCGEGGVVLTDSERTYERIKLLRSHGRIEEGEDFFSKTGESDYIELGYNFRLSSISATLLASQFQRVSKIHRMRKDVAAKITEMLQSIPEIRLPVTPLDFTHIYQMFMILLDSKEHRDGLRNHLNNNKIMTKVYFHPIHLKTLYQNRFGCKKGDLPDTEKISNRILALPMSAIMSNEEIHLLTKTVQEFFQK